MNNRVLSILIILVLLLAALPASPAYAAEVMIDDFNTVHQNIINTGSSPPATRASSSAAMGTVTGGWQSLAITRTIGAAPNQVANASGSSAAPALVYGHSQDPSQEAYSAVHWDGNSDPDTINPIGLGGVDLVNGTNTHVILGHYFNDWPINYVMTVWTDAGNWSYYSFPVLAFTPATVFVIPMTSFNVGAGTGADFENVGAIRIEIDGRGKAGLDCQLDYFMTGTPTAVTLSDLGASPDAALFQWQLAGFLLPVAAVLGLAGVGVWVRMRKQDDE